MGGKFIDLERNYFVFRNKIFKITAIRNVPQQTADSFLSSLLGQPVTLSENHPADANSVVHKLHQFLTDNVPLTESFSVILEWGVKNGWGSSNLISSLTVEDGKIQEVSTTMNVYAHSTRDAKRKSVRLLDKVVGND